MSSLKNCLVTSASTGKVPGLNRHELDEVLSDNLVDTEVTVEACMGTLPALVGVISAETREVLDSVTLTRNCPECSKWKGQDTGRVEYL